MPWGNLRQPHVPQQRYRGGVASDRPFQDDESAFSDGLSGHPDTGCLEGTASLTSFQRMPGGDPTSKEWWVFTAWFYLGRDSEGIVPDGARGSAVWTAWGDVVGFLCHAPEKGAMKGWAACTAADELIDRGFALVDTRECEEVTPF